MGLPSSKLYQCCCTSGDEEMAKLVATCDGKKGKTSTERPITSTDRANETQALDLTPDTTTGDHSLPSITFHSDGGPDTEAFKVAYSSRNLSALVRLMDNEPVNCTGTMHEWSENPKTVGALVTAQLAVKASFPEEPEIKTLVRLAGAIPKLVGFLQSTEPDRVQLAALALSFLCLDNPGNATAVYEGGAMAALIKHMDSDVEGLASSAASVCRSMMLEHHEWDRFQDTDVIEKRKDEFMSRGGQMGYIKLLEFPSDFPDRAQQERQKVLDRKLEMLLFIFDFIEDSKREVVPKYAKVMGAGGLRARLKDLFSLGDQEVEHLASELLKLLDQVSA